jgi:phosphatidate cytidylyltransferase
MNNHRLFLSISPKKSWEGFFGGLILAVAGAVALRYLGLLDLSLCDAIVLGIIICIFGVVGDLVESQLKRNFGVKDSGSIMPGHGGMLDRFDGALLAFPVAIIYLIFFAA